MAAQTTDRTPAEDRPATDAMFIGEGTATPTTADFTPDFTPADAVREQAAMIVAGIVDQALIAAQAAAEEAHDSAGEIKELTRRYKRVREVAVYEQGENLRLRKAADERDEAERVARARMTVMDDRQREIVGLRAELAARDRAHAEATAQVERLGERLIEATARALRYELIPVPGKVSPWSHADEAIKAHWRTRARVAINWGDEVPAHDG